MLSLALGRDAEIARWVGRRLGIEEFGPAAAIGVVEDGTLVAGIVYSGWRDRPGALEMSIASTSPRWCRRWVLEAAFRYPFEQLGARRVQATVRRGNGTARRFVERLGFRYEGMAREAWPTGEDAAVYSMLRRECRWTGDRHGKTTPQTTPRTRPGQADRGPGRGQPDQPVHPAGQSALRNGGR